MNLLRALLSPVAVFSILGLTAVGCRKAEPAPIDNADEEQLAADGTESSAASAQSTHIDNLVFSTVMSPSPATAADNVASAPKLWPAGCVTRVKDAQNPLLVHITFDECTGPFGLIHLNGGEDVTFSTDAGGLHAAFQSVNLSANGRPITHTASADITIMGNDRQIDWQGHWSRVDDKGDEVEHDSSLTILVDISSGCRTSNGTATTSVAARGVDTTVKDYKICRDAATGVDGCPTGTVTHTGKLNHKTVTIDFDGSNEASFEISGESFSVPLICGG